MMRLGARLEMSRWQLFSLGVILGTAVFILLVARGGDPHPSCLLGLTECLGHANTLAYAHRSAARIIAHLRALNISPGGRLMGGLFALAVNVASKGEQEDCTSRTYYPEQHWLASGGRAPRGVMLVLVCCRCRATSW